MTTTATDRTGDLCDADTGELIGPADKIVAESAAAMRGAE